VKDKEIQGKDEQQIKGQKEWQTAKYAAVPPTDQNRVADDHARVPGKSGTGAPKSIDPSPNLRVLSYQLRRIGPVRWKQGPPANSRRITRPTYAIC
jgi:hypothetical protein